MGKSSVQIEHDIERQRQRLSGRISRLDRRVRDDIDSVKDEARERTRQAQEKARETADKTRDMAKERTNEAREGEHPRALTGIAFGAGAILGWATGRERDDELEREVARAVERQRLEDESSSRLAGIVSSVFHSAVSYAGSQSAGLAKTAAKKGATTAAKSVRTGQDPTEAHRKEHESLRRAETAELASGQSGASRREDEIEAARDAVLSEVHQV